MLKLGRVKKKGITHSCSSWVANVTASLVAVGKDSFLLLAMKADALWNLSCSMMCMYVFSLMWSSEVELMGRKTNECKCPPHKK